MDSDILQSATNAYKEGKWDGQTKLFSFGGLDLIRDTWRNGTIFNITGLVGSAAITFTPQANDIIKVTIFNITSLTSGTLGKEIFPETWYPKSYVDDPNSDAVTKYGNISQTYSFTIQNPKK